MFVSKNNLLTVYFLLNSIFLIAQNIDINNIEIARDSFGIPHIYAKTDAQLAYGLAWAHAEDDFKTIQEAYLAGNSLLSKHIGLRGAPIDFLSQLIRPDEIIDSLYKTLDKNFIEVIMGYAEGLNSFADNHPEQVLVDKLFPITPRKMLKYSLLQLFIFSEGEKAVYQYLIILLGLLTQVMIAGLDQIFLYLAQKKQKIMKLTLV